MFAALGFLKSAQLDVGTRLELQELLTLWGTFRLCGAYTQMKTVFNVTLPHCCGSIRETLERAAEPLG